MEDRARRSRKWGFACLNCRKKKVRCDGGKPQCTICIKAGDECAYKASDAVNLELNDEIRRKVDEVACLKDHIRLLSTLSGPARDAALTELVEGFDGDKSSIEKAAQTSPAETARVSELSVDDSGHIRHYGATSRFHSKPYENPVSEPDLAEEDYHRKWLRSNARFQPSWEAKALERLKEPPFCHDIDPENAKVLLEIYWTWQAPLHNCVYRRCFYRDMALGGPYFSTFLLYVLFAHAGRHIPDNDPRFPNFNKGEMFIQKAKQILMNDLEVPKIPTAQGLLTLGGRMSAIGKTSEGWLMTSLAVGMIKDLGLHLRKDAGSLLKDLEPDDLEARKRLYLSAYIWDKTISLCIGRQPSLPEMPYPPNCLLDDADNHELWHPRHLDDELSNKYPRPTYSYNTDNFMSFVNLATIVTQVYAAIYGNQAALNPAIVYELERKLRKHHQHLPSHLKIEDSGQDTISPPSHIATVDILYHTALILLFRPFYQSDQPSDAFRELTAHAHRVCRAEAEAVNAKFRSYGRTYNFRNQTHLLSYCVYTAATVDVHGMQSKDPVEAQAASERLDVTLRMLDTEVEQTPGVRRSVDIIRSQTQQIGQRPKESEALPTPAQPSSATANASFETVALQNNLQSGAQQLLSPAAGTGLPQAMALPMYQQSTQQLQPFALPNDPTLTAQDFENLGDMSWFDWNELDISGGFGSHGYGGW